MNLLGLKSYHSERVVTVVLTVLMLSVASSAFGQLRESVVILEAEPDAAFSSAFEQVADRFAAEGNEEASRYFRSLTQGWHGSGFFLSGPESENYLVTNRHVVEYADFVTVEIENSEGESTTVGRVDLVYVDADADLAVLTVPGSSDRPALGLSDAEAYEDGSDVYAAGYPGLFGEAAWQLSRGTVTNQRAFVEGLIDPQISHLIQHSASIDPGNSGGPLLVRSSDDDQYSVVGINTWTVGGRRNTFFAIPTEQLRRVLDEYEHFTVSRDDPGYVLETAAAAANTVAALARADRWIPQEYQQIISNDLAGEMGWDSVLRFNTEREDTTEENGSRAILSRSPFDILREYSAWAIWHTFQSQAVDPDAIEVGAFDQLPDSLVEGAEATTSLVVDGRDLEVTLVMEHGNWRLRNIEFLYPVTPVQVDYSPDEEEEEAADLDRFNQDAIAAGLAIVPGAWNKSYSGSNGVSGIQGYLQIRTELAWFASFSIGLAAGYVDLTIDDYFDNTTVDERFTSFSVPALLLLRYPISIDDLGNEIVPIIGVGAAIETYFALGMDSTGGMGIGFSPRFGGGVEYYRAQSGWGIGLGVWKRITLGVMTFDEIPGLDDILMDAYLLWEL